MTERELWIKLSRIGIKNKTELRKAFGKDGLKIRAGRNMGIRAFNEVCIILKKYKHIRYGVSKNNTCLVCGEKVEPIQVGLYIQKGKNYGGEVYGYLCGCTEYHRGDK